MLTRARGIGLALALGLLLGTIVSAAPQPAWLVNHTTLHEWIEIPNTSGAGGAAIFAYSGFAFRWDTSEILIALAGGHQDSSDNRVTSIKLTDDQPQWIVRHQPSPDVARHPDVTYYDDGQPASRHVYSMMHWVPQVHRVMAFGARYTYGTPYEFYTVDGFNPDTNQWDPKGTWPSTSAGNYGQMVVPSTGHCFSESLTVWTPENPTFQKIHTSLGENFLTRSPLAYDSKRNVVFQLQWADGQGYSAQARFASRLRLNASHPIPQEEITFNPSVAADAFNTERPGNAAMDYDAPNDRFLFYDGYAASHIFVITPNDGTVWDMSFLSIAGTPPTPIPGAGLHNKFRYVPALKGFVILTTHNTNLHFFRTVSIDGIPDAKGDRGNDGGESAGAISAASPTAMHASSLVSLFLLAASMLVAVGVRLL